MADDDTQAATKAAIDALFQGPLAEFVNERNRLARALKARDRDTAERVRTLAKPSLSAWAVNQAYWNARPAFEAMLDAGEAMRALQQRAMRGEAATGMAEASARLHEAMAPVARAAQEALEQDGHSAAPQLMRRVNTTLKALAAHGRAETAPPAGRLSADVDAPGFDLLAALAPAQGLVRRTPRPDASAEAAPSSARPGARAGAHGHDRPAHPPRVRLARADQDRPAAGTPEPPEAPADDADGAAAAEPAHAPGPGAGARRTAPRLRLVHHRPAQTPRSRQEAQARHAARNRASAAKAAFVARQRALASAERAERAASERLEAAAAAVAAAQAALDRATMARNRATQIHSQAAAEADQARAEFQAAREELESAENQVRAHGRGTGSDGPDPS
jgi:hypothetical protein